ncbi:MAG TPA: abortive phage infection protein [Anaerolineaceae bacterium]|nr:abortive phage infection protein [Anaerolineaceae bacterium]
MPPIKHQFKERKRSYMDRSAETTEKRQRFLIVCEGKKTEPNYFNQFHVPGLVIAVRGVGMNTLSLVDEAKRLRTEDEYDQVWCVFDKDDFPIDHFENAIKRANENNMKVAYSNQAFELWYLLHFEYLQTAIDRKAYFNKLTEYLGFEYEKNSTGIYKKLLCKRDQAIKYAQRLMKGYNPPHPGRDDPSTCVHELVIALLENSQPLSRR